MDLNGGEIAILVLLLLKILLNAFLHGNDKEEKYNLWVALIDAVFAFLIYKWAGLF